MNKVELKRIAIKNFKGVKIFEAYFYDKKSENVDLYQEITIKGRNESGKTTVLDAFWWCLFDKDSNGRTDFEVKTIDPKTKKVIPKIEHEVEVEILENGDSTTFKKVLLENWKNKRGANEETYTGNQKKYYWEGVKLKKKKDYEDKVAKIITEDLFKLLTNPMHFNNLKWTDQRDQLLGLVPALSDVEFAKKNNYDELLKKVGDKKTVEQHKEFIKTTISENREEVKYLPSRIDEKYNDIDENLEDKSYYEGEILKAEKRIEEINQQIENSGGQSKAKTEKLKEYDSKIAEHNKMLTSAKESLYNHYYDLLQQAKNSLSTNENNIDNYNRKLNSIDQSLEFENDSRILNLRKELEDKDKRLNEKRNEFRELSKKEFQELKTGETCDCCGQEITGDHLAKKNEELKAEYNKQKSDKLAEINEEGNAIKRVYSSIKEQLDNSLKEVEKLQSQKEEIEKDYKKLKSEYIKLKATVDRNQKEFDELDYSNFVEVQELESKIYNLKIEREKLAKSTDEDNSNEIDQLKNERKDWEALKKEHNDNLHKVETNQKTEKRIKELKNEESRLQNEIAKLQKDEFEIDNFEKHKMRDFEKRINDMFDYVDFKLFDEQINGGFKTTCEALVDGVPYREVNTAGKVNAGIDIINVFSNYYGKSAPIFIDNRESVTDILETNSQVINLQVDKTKNELEVNKN